jgi:hypothetical protein
MKIKKNGKVIKLTESDLQRIVKKVLTEQINYSGNSTETTEKELKVEDLEFRVFVKDGADITGVVSKPRVMNDSNGYRAAINISTKEDIFDENAVIGVEIKGNIGGKRVDGRKRRERGMVSDTLYYGLVGSNTTTYFTNINNTKIVDSSLTKSGTESFYIVIKNTNILPPIPAPADQLDLLVNVVLNDSLRITKAREAREEREKDMFRRELDRDITKSREEREKDMFMWELNR